MNHPAFGRLAAIAILALLAPLALPAVAAPVAAAAAQYPADTYVLRVDGLACPYCAYGIEKQFSGMRGVTDTSIDIENGVVVVRVKPGTHYTAEQIKTTVDDAGFALKRIVASPQQTR
ncbi:MAG: heavy-metal-associated domain-containing protein [Rhodanobacteraceae bacterium]